MPDRPGFITFVPPATIVSPCVNVCIIDPVMRRCEGCARTLDEIGRWTAMTEAERASVMADLPRRA